MPDGSLIIIDVGPRTTPLVDWLHERVRQIHSIVITHNDADHAGGLPSLIQVPSVTIGTIYMLADRDKDDQNFQRIYAPVRLEEKKGRLKVLRLEKDRQIWQNGSKALELSVVYPDFGGNIDARKPNETSAIVCLYQNRQRAIIWPGDSPMKIVADTCAGPTPWLLSGPHHGGPVDRKHRDFAKSVDAIQPTRLFVSVGTKRNYELPAPGYLLQRWKHGCHIMCTQLTKHCDAERVNKEIPVLQTSAFHGLRPPRTGVPCRGCFRMTITDTEIFSDSYDYAHLEKIERLKRPKCLGR